ncbi:hypothetical protein BH23ACT3_BH23ACT3_11560 [soil metagenome]
MSDQRGDEPGHEPDPDHQPDPDHTEGERPSPPDDFEIAEMSPPPTPASADEPTAVGGPIVPPPDFDPAETDPAGTEPGDRAAAPPPVVPVGPGTHPAATDPVVAVREDPSWPTSAKATVAVLVVLALLGVAGTIFGLTRASSAEDDADDVEAELATAQDRIVALEDQLASLGDESGTMSERVDQLTSERDQALAERDAVIVERDEQLAIADAEQTLLATRIAELEAEVALLEEAVGELDGQFPLVFQSDLGQLDIDGNYAVSFTEIGCTGLELCGSAPGNTTATISSAGGLRLVAPDLFDVPLVVVDGTPFGVADSESLVPPCSDTPREAALTMALFDNAVEIDEEGSATVTALGATIVVDAPATDECEIGRVWYRAELTRQG